jgi:hypothetical protein
MSQNLKILKPVKTYMQDHYVSLIRNMTFMTNEYGVSISFCRKLMYFGKTEIWIHYV